MVRSMLDTHRLAVYVDRAATADAHAAAETCPGEAKFVAQHPQEWFGLVLNGIGLTIDDKLCQVASR